ncbi:hypothetical protein VY88_33205 [Azospirillum thiophilum]|uniref:Initiator Rep protein WH1 domain-containing protein n=1 Tax=Azospirillum thiophilum TaxID=528244 RepID=A0AAC9EYT4_9PROT|nr:hypothetical protein AL072_32955 [Azospirillum thiophilum]KJR61193.1 hypothetical protein VY88_33205 [Azospirillum thiophilum]
MPKAVGATVVRRVVEPGKPDPGPLSATEQQLYTLLIALAYPRIMETEVHTFTLAHIRRAWTYRMRIPDSAQRAADDAAADGTDNPLSVALAGGHRSYDRLRTMFDRLLTTLVEWDMWGEDGRPGWAKSTLLASCSVQEGADGDLVVKYAFAPHLRPLIGDPALYSNLRLRVLFAFTSSYAIPLYEWAQRFADRRTLPWRETMTVGRLRELLDVTPGTLKDWAQLRRRALDPAIQQVNAYSEFDLDYEVIRAKERGAPVEEVVWQIKRKSRESLYALTYKTADRQKPKDAPGASTRPAKSPAPSAATTNKNNTSAPVAQRPSQFGGWKL